MGPRVELQWNWLVVIFNSVGRDLQCVADRTEPPASTNRKAANDSILVCELPWVDPSHHGKVVCQASERSAPDVDQDLRRRAIEVRAGAKSRGATYIRIDVAKVLAIQSIAGCVDRRGADFSFL